MVSDVSVNSRPEANRLTEPPQFPPWTEWIFVMRAVSFQRSKPLTMPAATREIVARPGCVAPSATAARKSISLPFANPTNL